MLKQRIKHFLKVLKNQGIRIAVKLSIGYFLARVKIIKRIIARGHLNRRNFIKFFHHLKVFGFKATYLQVKNFIGITNETTKRFTYAERNINFEERFGDIDNLALLDSEVAIDIIVCIHNSLELVKKCLFSIISNTTNPYRFIIVNDGSDSETSAWLYNFSKLKPNTILINNSKAQGYVKAANIGIKLATSSFVILVNSDTEVTWNWALKMVHCARSKDFVGAVGPFSNQATSQSIDINSEIYSDYYFTNPIYPSLGFLNGFCFAMTRRAIVEVGLFDEDTFSPGYGEENDWCIRARALGFHMLVADDVFVAHRGSSSYGSERARELEKIAHEKLHLKHGAWLMNDHWQWTGKNPGLLASKLRYSNSSRLKEARKDLQKFSGKTVAIVLSAAHRSGGANVILSEAKRMQEAGVSIRIINHQDYRDVFLQEYPWVASESGFELRWIREWESMGEALDSDVVIATLFRSVHWIEESLKKVTLKPLKAYYIQDYEPWFFDKGTSDFQEAEQSYRIAATWKCFTKTEWNAATLVQEAKIRPHVIGKSVELRDYYPGSTLNKYRNKMQIIAMVRPETPRRSAERTIEILNRIQTKFGDHFNLAAFGLKDSDLAAKEKLDPQIMIHGQLNSSELRSLFQNSDIFLDLSEYQAMGLTALEAMACGLMVISDSVGGIVEFLGNNKNGFFINRSNFEKEFFKVLKEISDNPSKFDEYSFNNVTQSFDFAPEFAAKNILRAIFEEN